MEVYYGPDVAIKEFGEYARLPKHELLSNGRNEMKVKIVTEGEGNLR